MIILLRFHEFLVDGHNLELPKDTFCESCHFGVTVPVEFEAGWHYSEENCEVFAGSEW